MSTILYLYLRLFLIEGAAMFISISTLPSGASRSVRAARAASFSWLIARSRGCTPRGHIARVTALWGETSTCDSRADDTSTAGWGRHLHHRLLELTPILAFPPPPPLTVTGRRATILELKLQNNVAARCGTLRQQTFTLHAATISTV